MQITNKPFLMGIALVSCLIPYLAHAAAGQDGVIIVTATRLETVEDKVAVSTTVLDSKAIDAAQTISVSELLAAAPGVSFTRNGGPGQTSQIRIRGADADQTTTLLDGVKLNDPAATGGGYDFGNLIAGDIDRIEILRGPQSTLWGSQAIGGVVNVITAAPANGVSGAASIEGGSYGTLASRAHVSIGDQRVAVRIGASHYSTDGISAFDKRLGGAEADSFRQNALTGRVDINLTDAIALDYRLGYFDSKADIDGFPAPLFAFADTREYTEVKTLTSYAGLRFSAFDNAFKNRLGYAFTRTDRDNFDPDSFFGANTFDSRGTASVVDYQGEWTINESIRAVFGAESERTWFRVASIFSPTPTKNSVQQDSGFAQLQVQALPNLTLTGGARLDRHDSFGDHATFQGGAVLTLNDGATLLRANYGEGFKAPSLYQLFGEFGDIALKPEESEGWDAGITQRFFDGAFSVTATYFRRDSSNQIDFVDCTTQCATRPFGLYANTAKTEASGVELEFAAQVNERLSLGGNFNWLEATNQTPGSLNFGKDLPRRPAETGALEATYLWPTALSTTLALRYVGDSYDDAANSAPLDSYALVDLRASWPLNDAVEIYGRVENLTDERYETLKDYGTPGRAAYLGVRVKLQ